MAKFHGAVGYAETVRTAPGIWEEKITEHFYKGDVIRNTNCWEVGSQLNDNLNINNVISIVADAFAYENSSAIRYVKWMGTLWKVTKVEVQRPRLILMVGGVYNEP